MPSLSKGEKDQETNHSKPFLEPLTASRLTSYKDVPDRPFKKHSATPIVLMMDNIF